MGDARMVDASVRHGEPDDYEAIHRILSGPRASSDPPRQLPQGGLLVSRFVTVLGSAS